MKDQYDKPSHQKCCSCCGREDHLKFCENCQVWMCFDTDEEIGGCWEWTSSHNSMCPVIFNYHHPNLDEEIAFYDRLRYFENNMVVP